MMEWCWMPALVASLGGGSEPELPPLAAGAALVRATEVLERAANETVLAIDSILCESMSAHGGDRTVVTLQLSVSAPDETAARGAFESLGRRIAARPWWGEEADPEYPRWVQAFEGSLSGSWTPGHEGRAPERERTWSGLVSFVLEGSELIREPVPVHPQGEQPRGAEGMESFIRESAARDVVKVGQVDISWKEHRNEDGPAERVWAITPVGKRFSRLQVGNLLYLLDTRGPEAGRVTRVELRRVQEPSEGWTFALEYSLRSW